MHVSLYALNLADVQQSQVSPERTTCGLTEFQEAHTDVTLTTHPAGHLSRGRAAEWGCLLCVDVRSGRLFTVQKVTEK